MISVLLEMRKLKFQNMKLTVKRSELEQTTIDPLKLDVECLLIVHLLRKVFEIIHT